jgi:CubicO group peptidase (beta-lactamase class C family)
MKKILLFLLLLNSSMFSQELMDDFGEMFITAINSDSENVQKEIVLNIFSKSTIDEVGMERLLVFIEKMHSDFSPLTYHHSEILSFDYPGGKNFIMHIYAKQPDAVMWQDFQIRLDPEPPHKLKTIAFIAEVSEPVTLPNGGIDKKETLDWLSNYLEELKSKYDLYGSILIAKNDKPLFEKYYGFADVDKEISITDKTLFNIASGGKMFTALCIAKLVEENKIRYDDLITKYLNEFTDTTSAKKVTVHQLLSHTSGVAEYWTDETDDEVYSATKIKDHLELVYKSGFDFEPGTSYQYSNSNYILLGAIFEKVTGKSFYEYVQETVFNPAGMSSSGYFNYGSESTAIPLSRGQNENEWVEAVHGIRGSSAGGAYSNSTDILKFSMALKHNKIVSEKTFTNMLLVKNTNVKESANFDYGYGFEIIKSEQAISYGHGGIADGVNFEFRYFPDSDITLVVFCNQNNGAYDDLKKNAIKLITGER